MNDVEFQLKMNTLEFFLGIPYGSFIIQIWDSCYMMGTDKLAYMVRFPYPMYREQAIESLINVAKGMINE